MQHLSKVKFTTPQEELFYFQGGDITAKYDLVNWQSTPQGGLQLVLIGRVDGFDLHLNDTVIEWSTGSNQVLKKKLLTGNADFFIIRHLFDRLLAKINVLIVPVGACLGVQ